MEPMAGMTGRRWSWRLAAALAALLLTAYAAVEAARDFRYQFGIDFYHLWGVPHAQSRSIARQNPYADTEAYSQFLNGVSAASGSEKLRAANGFRRTIEPTGTPLFYAAFSVLPGDFDRAYALHAALAFIAFWLAVFLLARLRGLAPPWAACVAALVVLTFNPFVQDVKYGNVSSLQLLFMAAMLHVAVRRRYPASAALEALAAGAIALFVLFKPNTVWIAAAFAAHYALVRPPRRVAGALLAGAALALLGFAAGAWFYRDAGAWADWLRYIQGLNGGTLLYTLEKGNKSLPMWLAQRSMAYGPLGYGVLIGTLLGLALLAALTALGRRPLDVKAATKRLLGDPWCAMSLGVLFTIACSPLLWAYYHVFLLIPIFWLFRGEGRWDGASAWAALGYLALSRPVIGPLLAAGHLEAIDALMLLAWTPLVPGILARLARAAPAAWGAEARSERSRTLDGS
jgi:hypothetical protein